ncbi:MAG: hypothetical protein K1X64_00970 [Myxococcaceae bacterium]|nr:hypothetical protein [Myxococcaceae bacterium]
MNPPTTHWTQGLLALAFGLVASIAFVLFARRAFKAAPSHESSVDDLRARYTTLIAQLKEHAQAKHLMPAEQWSAEEQRLSSEAAALLRQRDDAVHSAEKAKARADKKAQQDALVTPASAALKVVVWVSVAAVFVGVVALVLNKEATERKEDLQQQQQGGNAAARPPSPEELAKVQQAIAAAQDNPNDIDALANAAWVLIRNQRFEDAAPLISRASFLDPYHVQTRVQRAILDAVQGNDTAALTELEHLTQTYADTGEAHLYAGTLSMGLKDPVRALAHFDRYLALVPVGEQPPNLRQGVENLRAQLQGR